MLKEVLGARDAVRHDSMPAARTRFNIGSVALAKNDFAAALPLIEGAVPIFRKSMGEQHVEVAQVLRSRATCRKGLGDLPGIGQDLEDALAIYGRATKPTFGPRLRTVQSLVEVRCLLGEAESARRLADEAVRARWTLRTPTRPSGSPRSAPGRGLPDPSARLTRYCTRRLPRDFCGAILQAR